MYSCSVYSSVYCLLTFTDPLYRYSHSVKGSHGWSHAPWRTKSWTHRIFCIHMTWWLDREIWNARSEMPVLLLLCCMLGNLEWHILHSLIEWLQGTGVPIMMYAWFVFWFPFIHVIHTSRVFDCSSFRHGKHHEYTCLDQYTFFCVRVLTKHLCGELVLENVIKCQFKFFLRFEGSLIFAGVKIMYIILKRPRYNNSYFYWLYVMHYFLSGLSSVMRLVKCHKYLSCLSPLCAISWLNVISTYHVYLWYKYLCCLFFFMCNTFL